MIIDIRGVFCKKQNRSIWAMHKHFLKLFSGKWYKEDTDVSKMQEKLKIRFFFQRIPQRKESIFLLRDNSVISGTRHFNIIKEQASDFATDLAGHFMIKEKVNK